jgi:hypothetical protein
VNALRALASWRTRWPVRERNDVDFIQDTLSGLVPGDCDYDRVLDPLHAVLRLFAVAREESGIELGHVGYHNWSDFLVFFVFFVLGYLVCSESRYTNALEKNRWPLLAVALVSSLFVHTTFMTGHIGEWMGNPTYSPVYLTL